MSRNDRSPMRRELSAPMRLHVPAGDADALAVTLIDLLRQPERLRDMGERGRRFVRGRFPWTMVARRVDGPLRRALAEKG